MGRCANPPGDIAAFSSHLEFWIPGESAAVEVERSLLRYQPKVPQKELQVGPAIRRVRHTAERPHEQFPGVIEFCREGYPCVGKVRCPYSKGMSKDGTF
jgi:hypothetical protein